METHFIPGQNYDCVRCSKGCREQWRIHADPRTEQRIAESELAARRIAETGVAEVFTNDPENGSRVLTRHNGACIFLQEDNRCAVHSQLGVTAKPQTCRMFPFLTVNTPDGLYVGISYYCTAAKRNLGRPMSAHVWSVKELAPLQRMYTAGFDKQSLCTGSNAVMEWPVYRRLEELVREDGTARAVWALAELSAGEGSVPRAVLEEVWRNAQPEQLVSDACLVQHTQFTIAATLCTLEVKEADARKEAIESFLSGKEVHLTHIGWSGTAESLEALAASIPETANADLARYEKALIFRKFLALHRPLLDNAVILHLMPRLFRLYAAISAAKREATAAEQQDVEYAIDRTELFLTHLTNEALDRLLGEYAEGYARQIEAMKEE